jgi:DNA-binding protein HU-beta
MHRNDFVKEISKKTSVPQKQVNDVVGAALDVITETLGQGDKIVLTGFGTFEMRERKERQGVNPQTKKPITIAASRTPGFTASSSLKQRTTK